jgi:hypothetical protein
MGGIGKKENRNFAVQDLYFKWEWEWATTAKIRKSEAVHKR